MIYCDTSLLVAALSREAATEAVQQWLSQQAEGVLSISDWVITEFSSAVSIKLRRGEIPVQRKADLLAQWQQMIAERLTVVPVPQPAFALAARFCDRHELGLRAGDALHLAVASLGGHALATLDARMREGAAAVGVRVVGV